MEDITYSQACVEVLEVLKHIKKEDIKKIPRFKIDLYEKNRDKNYKFEYNKNLKYEDQKISKKAKAILANLYIDYWISEQDRHKIKNDEIKQINDYEKNNKLSYEKKYNSNLYKTNKENNEVSIIKYEKRSFLERIKKFFTRR